MRINLTRRFVLAVAVLGLVVGAAGEAGAEDLQRTPAPRGLGPLPMPRQIRAYRVAPSPKMSSTLGGRP